PRPRRKAGVGERPARAGPSLSDRPAPAGAGAPWRQRHARPRGSERPENEHVRCVERRAFRPENEIEDGDAVPTIQQLVRKGRQDKVAKTTTPALKATPQRPRLCTPLYTT